MRAAGLGPAVAVYNGRYNQTRYTYDGAEIHSVTFEAALVKRDTVTGGYEHLRFVSRPAPPRPSLEWPTWMEGLATARRQRSFSVAVHFTRQP
jgi:hypothetical protein